MPHCAETAANRVGGPWVAGGQGLAVEASRAKGPAGSLSAYCRARSTRVRITILDISTTGCLLDLRTWGLKAGDRMLIKLPGLAYLPANLQWVEDGRGGLVFEQPLHEAVLRYLLEATNSRPASHAAG